MFARRKKKIPDGNWGLHLRHRRVDVEIEALATLWPDNMNEHEEGGVPKTRDMFSAQILPFPVRKLQIYVLLSADIDND